MNCPDLVLAPAVVAMPDNDPEMLRRERWPSVPLLAYIGRTIPSRAQFSVKVRRAISGRRRSGCAKGSEPDSRQGMRCTTFPERFSGQADLSATVPERFGTQICSMYGYQASTRIHFLAGPGDPGSRAERFWNAFAVGWRGVLVCRQPRPSPTCQWERSLPSPLSWSRLQTACEEAGLGMARP
jgi:hypothetical protein